MQNFLSDRDAWQNSSHLLLSSQALKMQSQKSKSSHLGIVQNHRYIFKGYILHFDLAYKVKKIYNCANNNWTARLQKDFYLFNVTGKIQSYFVTLFGQSINYQNTSKEPANWQWQGKRGSNDWRKTLRNLFNWKWN